MNNSTAETQFELDDLRSRLVARAVARADSARQAIDRIAALDAEILQGVLELAPAEVRDLHVDDIFVNETAPGDLTKGIDRVFANLMGMAATIRRRDASSDFGRAQIVLLLDDLQILHRQLDFLQKFLLASDLLSEWARSAYANKYRLAESAKDVAAAKLGDNRADSPAASEATLVNQQPPAKDIIVTCRHCSKQFTAPQSLAGKQVKCLNCHQPLLVPAPSSFPSAKPSAATPAAAAPPTAAAAAAPAAAATPAPTAVSSLPGIPVACPRCRRRFLAQSWLAGKSADCPSCGQTIPVPHGGSQFAIDLAYDTDPLSGLPSLDDFDVHSASRPVVPTSRRTLPRQTYSARKPGRGFDQEELPRWVWYAMGAALGLGVLVLMMIVASSLWRGAHRPSGQTELTRASEPAGPQQRSHADLSKPPPADPGSDAAVGDSTPGEPGPGTASGESRFRQHTSLDGAYSILVPGPVSHRTQADYVNGVTRYVDWVELPKGAGFLEVSYADHPLSADSRAALSGLWQAAAARWRASTTQSTDMDYKGYPAQDIRFVSEDPLFPTGRVLIVVVRRGESHRLYMIVRSGPEGCADSDEAETTFQSFRVLP